MSIIQRDNMTQTLTNREEFLVIGLTGRVGAGCSRAASILGSDIRELRLPAVAPGPSGLKNDNERDRRIIFAYADNHWLAFDIIQVRSVIATFLLNDMRGFAKDYLSLKNEILLGSEEEKAINDVLDGLEREVYAELDRRASEALKRMRLERVKTILSEKDSKEKNPEKKWSKILDEIEKYEATKENGDMSVYSKEVFAFLYKEKLQEIKYEERREYCEEVNRLLYAMSAIEAFGDVGRWRGKVWEELQKLNAGMGKPKPQEFTFEHFKFVHDIMPAVAKVIHERLALTASADFTELFQKYGNCIRKFGRVIYDHNEILKQLNNSKRNDYFAIPRKINQFIKVLRHPLDRSFNRPTRVVIDSIKNNFEAIYLRDRYSAFYLCAISTDEPTRIKRLVEDPQKRLNLEQVHFIDWNEYSSVGEEIYTRHKKKRGA